VGRVRGNKLYHIIFYNLHQASISSTCFSCWTLNLTALSLSPHRMSVPPPIEIKTVALACQIICFAASEHSSVSKVNVHTLQTAQQVSSQYSVAIPPSEDQPSDQWGWSAEVEELYLSDWVVDPHIFKQAIASFERAMSTLRKDTPSDSSSADKPEEQPHNNTETPCTTSYRQTEKLKNIS